MTVIGIISLDNYDDLIDQMDDKYVSTLNSLVTTIISDWANSYHIFYKRLNSERYLFVANEENLEEMQQKKFPILNQVKEAEMHSEFILTISIGISYGQDNIETIGERAQMNLDLAQARGGDQVVVRGEDPASKPLFYGGNTDGTIRRTRTRSRAMSVALKRLFSENKKVFIMGHRFPDMDAIGASFGMATIAQIVEIEPYILINYQQLNPDVSRCIDELEKYPELNSLLIEEQAALELIDEDSLLVMIDHNKPSLGISDAVYQAIDKVIIVDHHRRSEEFPQRPLLTYIETSASSTSELVSEFIQFLTTRKQRLPRLVPTLLLAGIYVDTKNFIVRTTGKTFDVASFLKSKGADNLLIQYLLSSDLDSYLLISGLVARSKYYRKDILISVAEDHEIYDSITVAKTADTLLSLNGISASFVVTRQAGEKIGISARSTGKINVQAIMEALDGGGHFTNAATQISNKTLSEVQDMLYNELDQRNFNEE
ncbi:DHH family phosphoesterase [Enterococcus bulliens]